ncbi:MAG: restriction endonuclease subunit S [Eubacteriaceae bacterium]
MNREKKLVPKLRFPGFEGEWVEKRLGEISEKVTEKNKNREYSETLTNSAEYGIISQNDYFDKEISNEKNIDGYFVVRPDDFVYNPRISNYAPVGPIKRNKLNRTGVMSPLYYVFRTKDIELSFLEKYFDTIYWHKFMKLNGDTGARSDRFAIKDAVFRDMPIPYPVIEEQKKIGAFFKQFDDSIALQQRKLSHLQAQKKGLLQKMFPKVGQALPELRFPGFEGKWEQRKLEDFVKFFSGLTYSPNDIRRSGTLVLRSSNVKDGEIIDADNVYVDPNVVNSENVKEGDIIVVVRNGSRSLIGKHAEIKSFMPNTVIGAFMTGIRSEHPSFVNALLNTSRFEKEVAINMGSTINQITGYMFSKMEFYVPKEKEQDAIGDYFKHLDNLITLHQRKLAHLQARKKALLQQMFV